MPQKEFTIPFIKCDLVTLALDIFVAGSVSLPHWFIITVHRHMLVTCNLDKTTGDMILTPSPTMIWPFSNNSHIIWPQGSSAYTRGLNTYYTYIITLMTAFLTTPPGVYSPDYCQKIHGLFYITAQAANPI